MPPTAIPLVAYLVILTSATLTLLWAHENCETLWPPKVKTGTWPLKPHPLLPEYAQLAFYLLQCDCRMLLVPSQAPGVSSTQHHPLILKYGLSMKLMPYGGLKTASFPFPQSTVQKEPVKKTLTLYHNVIHPKAASVLSPFLES